MPRIWVETQRICLAEWLMLASCSYHQDSLRVGPSALERDVSNALLPFASACKEWPGGGPVPSLAMAKPVGELVKQGILLCICILFFFPPPNNVLGWEWKTAAIFLVSGYIFNVRNKTDMSKHIGSLNEKMIQEMFRKGKKKKERMKMFVLPALPPLTPPHCPTTFSFCLFK